MGRQGEGDLEGLSHLRMLIDPYRAECYYFEVVECFRKVLLTGITSVW